MYQPIKDCRVCHGTSLEKYLDLGKMPLVNRLLDSPTEEEPKFPLEVAYCHDCSLSQLSGVVDPKVQFSHYVYRSSVSKTFADHCLGLAKVAASDFGMRSGDLVIDIASNDGCLLQQFKAHTPGIKPLGVDPAKNLAEIAEQEGVPTLCDFWSPALADRIVAESAPAKIITATNVFAHVDDIHPFLDGVRKALRPDGTFIVEVPYLVDMMKDNIFDTIYHEHLSYYLLSPMKRVFREHGLHVNRTDRINIHGGSIRVYANLDPHPDGSVERIIERENRNGYLSPRAYGRLRRFARRIKEDLDEFLNYERDPHSRVAGFGASAKGCVMFNYCGVDTNDIAYVVDDTPEKQGKYMPGTRIPILSRDALRQQPPDYLIVLAWNFFPEIRQKNPEFEERGGIWVLPVPWLHTV